MEEEYTSRRILTEMVSSFADGMWNIDYRVEHSRKNENDEWETREISSSYSAKEFNDALAGAANVLYYYLQSCENDLFKDSSLELSEGEVLN